MTDAAQTSPEDTSAEDTSTDKTRRLRNLFVALVVVGVVVGALGVVVAVTGRFVPGDDQDERAAVVSRAEAYVTTYNTYDVTDKAGYQKRMKPLLTTKYYGQFKKVTDGVFSALGDRKQKSGDVDVLSVAVQSMDGDSATALVAVNAKISSEGEATATRRFRWKVLLSKSGDTWKVRDSQTVVPADATAGAPGAESSGATPSPTESSAGGSDQ